MTLLSWRGPTPLPPDPATAPMPITPLEVAGYLAAHLPRSYACAQMELRPAGRGHQLTGQCWPGLEVAWTDPVTLYWHGTSPADVDAALRGLADHLRAAYVTRRAQAATGTY